MRPLRPKELRGLAQGHTQGHKVVSDSPGHRERVPPSPSSSPFFLQLLHSPLPPPPTPQSSSLAHPPTHPPSLARASPGNEKTHPSQERRTLPAPRLRPRPPGRPPLLPRLGATDPAFVREPEPASFLRQVGPGLLSSPLFLPPSRPRPSRRLNSKGRREEEGQFLTPC